MCVRNLCHLSQDENYEIIRWLQTRGGKIVTKERSNPYQPFWVKEMERSWSILHGHPLKANR